jgi:hypothetical protein
MESTINWDDFNEEAQAFRHAMDVEDELVRMLTEEIDKEIISQVFNLGSIEYQINYIKNKLNDERHKKQPSSYWIKKYTSEIIELLTKKILKDHCRYEI